MTLARRLDRLANHWPHPADVLAARVTQEFQVASPSTMEDSAVLYRRCRVLMDDAGLSEAARLRALETSMIALGFPKDGVRRCMTDMPYFFSLAFACLGPAQVSDLGYPPESGQDRLGTYLDGLFSQAEQVILHEAAERLSENEER